MGPFIYCLLTEFQIQDPLSNFMYALRAPETRRKYPQRLKVFFDFVLKDSKDLSAQAIQFVKTATKNTQWIYSCFFNFIIDQNKRVERNEITAGTVRNYYKAAKLFCEMNDMTVNWKKISKGLIKEKEYGDDRAPTVEEIIELMKYPDRRIKPAVLVMASSGIRGGAWDYLKWKNVIPTKRDEKVVAAKLIVYAGEPEEYYTFISPEAYFSMKDWMNFRKSYGEEITGESWILRDLWQTTTHKRGTIGVALYPKRLKSSGIKSLIERALKTQGIERILKEGTNHNTRREWKALHGFRKFFNSVLINANVNYTVKERLMGHDTGLDNNYFKPNEKELLNEYLKAVNDLTINEEFRLKQQVVELSEKQDEIALMKLKHEREMKAMDERLNKIMSIVQQNPKLAHAKPEALLKENRT
jgi:hypothetical protein